MVKEECVATVPTGNGYYLEEGSTRKGPGKKGPVPS